METHHKIYGLDILRSIAILTVVYGHGIFIFGNTLNQKIYNIFSLDGVTVFFVLSGFLIGKILLETIEKNQFTIKDIFEFWKRRWFRTFPNYFFVLITIILFFSLRHAPLPPWSVLTKYFFFLQNFHTPHPAFFPEAWSLAVEECFYILLPLMLYFCFRIFSFDRKKIFLFIIWCVIICVNIYRLYKLQTYDLATLHAWDMHIKKQVLTRLDSLMIGVLSAFTFLYYKNIWESYKKPAFFIGLILLVYPQIHPLLFSSDIIFRNYFSLLSTTFGTFFLLPFLYSKHSGKGRFYQFFTFISKISYSMYLLHFTLVEWLLLPMIMTSLNISFSEHTQSLFRYSLYWTLTIGLSYLLYKFFEKPTTQLREKKFI